MAVFRTISVHIRPAAALQIRPSGVTPPFNDRICHAKLIEVHPSNISWNLLLVEIFNSPIDDGTYQVNVSVYECFVRRLYLRRKIKAPPILERVYSYELFKE